MHLFTNDQKREVSKLAKRAYDSWEGREGFEDANPELSRSACLEAWRHAETYKVTRRTQSLRECYNTDFNPLMGHFAHFLGDGAGALKHLLRHAEGARIQIFFKLQQILAERGLDEAYAAKIARCKYKKPLGECSEKQLWSVFFDCKKRPVVAGEAQKPAPRRIENSLGTLSTRRAGKTAAVAATLEQRLATAIAEERYEDAATLRDQLSSTKVLAVAPF